MSSFSWRHGYSGNAKEITIREAAPESIRSVALSAAAESGLNADILRDTVCRLLRKQPDRGNFSPERIWKEVESLVYRCEWFKVYDIIEAFDDAIRELAVSSDDFQKKINNCFIEEGIGWQLVDGEIFIRGDEGFQQAIDMTALAASQLQKTLRPTAASHIQYAIKALSERPKANTPGAVSHATNSVECLLNDITGQAMTLGQYLKKCPALFHPALKKALEGVYGYASDAGARHGKEGMEPTFDEAQFAVITCAAACTLLVSTSPKGKA